MAMGFLRSFDQNIEVQSAGIRPAAEINPFAIKAMQEVGIDLSTETPKSVELFLVKEWDFAINVCGGANESCPVFIGKVGKRMHIGFDDPTSATGTDEEIMAEFRRIRDEIKKEMQTFYLVDVKGLYLPKCCCCGG